MTFATDALPWQRSLRWTRPARNRWRIALGILLGVVLTLAELLGFGIGMRRRIESELPPVLPEVMRVELIEPAVVEVQETPPEPEPPPRPNRAERARSDRASRTSSRRRSVVSAEPASEIPPLLRFYSPDGRLQLPESALEAGEPVPGFRHPSDAYAHRDPFARANPLPYEPTRFDRYFPSVRETLFDELVRKATVTRTWRTPWGTEITCSVSVVLGMLGGCGWGYAPQATIEELKAMRADPPMPKTPPPATEKEPSESDTPLELDLSVPIPDDL